VSLPGGGVYTSAEEMKLEPEPWPPATRTLPSASLTAEW
jgi:hypothetical protein